VMFRVTHDAARPFTVQALDRRITDVGTRFEVGLAGDTLRVRLFEGSVRIDGVDAALTLKPGQQLVAQAGRPARVEFVPVAGHPDQELVTLDNVTLARAAEIINDGSRTRLVIADPEVARLRLSGRFKPGDADRFARTAAALLSLEVVRTAPGRIELRRAR
jgi:transmembrane sensor